VSNGIPRFASFVRRAGHRRARCSELPRFAYDRCSPSDPLSLVHCRG
jgi:hypothetical protein